MRREPPPRGNSMGGQPDRARTLRRSDRWSYALAALLFAGIVIRVAMAFPVHKYAADADAVVMGLRALTILDGEPVVFYSHLRLGALEAYLHAAAFRVLGPTREAMALPPLVSGCLFLLCCFGFLREVLGRRLATLAAVFLAVPSPAFLFWTYMPNSYPETMALCAAFLYVAARTARGAGGNGSWLLLGCIGGLAFWNSIQTLTCTLPAFVWLLTRRPDWMRRARFWLLLLFGGVAGAAPWLVYNVVHPLDSLQGFLAPRLAGGFEQFVSNARHLVTYNLRELLVGWSAALEGGPASPIWQAARIPILVVYLAAALALVAALFSRGRGSEGLPVSRRSAAALLLAIAISLIAVYVISGFGAERGLTVRYVLPLWPVAAASLAFLTGSLFRKSPLAAVLLASLLIAFNLAGYWWPGTPERREWEARMRRDADLVALLERAGIRWVIGDYWTVYPINFLSQRRVLAIPRQPTWDYLSYGDKLPAGSEEPWALVATTPDELDAWLARFPTTGLRITVASSFVLFLPPAPGPGAEGSRATAARLQRLLGPG